jgi:exo-beta-1,3-glucanase (GH17 family)
MKLFSWLTLLILLNGLILWATNLPQDVGADVPAGKLSSLSFAPFRDGQGPMDAIFPSAEELDEDLALMGQVTRNIRTYASAEGSMPLIPDLAKKHGLTMLQGAWLGALKADNDVEIAALIRSANEHPEVVKRVLVGNEVLLRGDLKPDELINYIRQVKSAVKQPVSYADVWSMYMKYPQLIKEVDFITIHILPYWEDEPIPVENAPAHVERIVNQVQQEANTLAPGKSILIGESGWPSAGKQRGRSIPSVVNEARFIRDFIAVANKNGFDYNIVEAFNQPWKAAFEGIIGANWGLYDSNRKQMFPLTGKVQENPAWRTSFLIQTGLFLLIVLLTRKQLMDLRTRRTVNFLVVSQLLSALLVSQSDTLWRTSYTHWQQAQTLIILLFSVWLIFLILQRMLILLNEKVRHSKNSQRLYYSLLMVVAYALMKTVILAWDGRYVVFPTAVTQIMVAGLLGLVSVNLLFGKMSFSRSLQWQALLGYTLENKQICTQVAAVFMGLGVALLVGETFAFMISRDLIMAYPQFFKRLLTASWFTMSNGQLQGWLLSLFILGLPFYMNKKAPHLNENY